MLFYPITSPKLSMRVCVGSETRVRGSAREVPVSNHLSFLPPPQFVAQPNCQQLLATLWYDGFPGWRRKHWAVKLLTCVTIGLLFPVLSVAYLMAPKSRLGLFIKKPFIKFICHTGSYLTFLFLLLLASQHIVRTDLHMQGPPPTIVEWMILPWVLGKSETHRCLSHGLLSRTRVETHSWSQHCQRVKRFGSQLH